jgi:uncharacterized protein (TIGR00290 family)
MQKLVLSWSGGKDSAISLYELRRSKQYEVVGLLTTITRDYDRVSMHGVRRILLEQQAESVGIPLRKILIPKGCTNEIYERLLAEEMEQFKRKGVFQVAFGDIFLQDLKAYREQNLAKVGMQGVFPIWKRDSRELVESFINLCFKSIITTCDPRVIGEEFCGRVIDKQFLSELPASVDPAGENGEFHSFAFDGPIFRRPVSFTVGEKVPRDGFWFCDLVPLQNLSRFSQQTPWLTMID